MADNRIPDERERRVQEPNLAGIDRGGAWMGWWWVWFFIIIVAAFWFAGWGWGGYGGWWWGRRPAVAEVNPNAVMSGSGIAIMDAPDKAVYVGQPFQLNEVPVQKKVSQTAMWVGSRSSGPMLVVASGANSEANGANGEANSGAAPAENTNNKNTNNRGRERNNAKSGKMMGSAANNTGSENGPNDGTASAASTSALTAIPANIKEGDRVQVSGTVEKAPPANVARQDWGLSPEGAQRLEQQGAFIQLQQVAKEANPPQR